MVTVTKEIHFENGNSFALNVIYLKAICCSVATHSFHLIISIYCVVFAILSY